MAQDGKTGISDMALGWLVIGGVVILWVGGNMLYERACSPRRADDGPTAKLAQATPPTASAPPKKIPSVPLPSFRFYGMKMGEGIVSVVVPTKTTDDQLRQLILYIRDRVRAGQFKAIGIKKPTNTNRRGELDYSAGTVIVYRGERCASEELVDSLGPCGYGDHSAAWYQWGIGGVPNNDSGGIKSKDGVVVKVF